MEMKFNEIYLTKGSHATRDEGMCAMEAVAWLAGETHSDAPQCTCPVIATFVRGLNDRFSDKDRQRLNAYLPRLIGTRRGIATECLRAAYLARQAVRVFAPLALERKGFQTQAASLRALPEDVDLMHARAAAETAAAAAAHAADAAAYADAAANDVAVAVGALHGASAIVAPEDQ